MDSPSDQLPRDVVLDSPPIDPSPSVTAVAPATIEAAHPPEPSRDAPGESRTRLREYAGVVLLCALGDVALYGGSGGLGHLLLFAGAPLVVLLARPERVVRSPRLVVLGGLLALVAARSLWQSSAFSFLVGFGLLFAFAVSASTSLSYVPEAAVSSMASMIRAVPTMAAWVRDLWERTTRGRDVARGWVAVVVPVVVVGAFALLFVAANPVLERWAGTAWEWTSALTFLPSPLRAFFWAFCALVAAAWLRPFVADLWTTQGAGDLHTLGSVPPIGPYRTPPRDDAPRSVAFATARNALVGVNVLFLLYNALDVVHLWAGRPPEGMIHTDYAHRGALWLTVALCLCTIVLSAIFRGELNFDARARTLRVLAFAWIAQGLWLAVGTFRRVQLYVDDSGLTTLRIVGFIGTTLVVVGLVLAATKVARRKTLLWLVRSQLDAFVVAIVLFTVVPTDWLATSFNVERIQRGRREPLLHLTEQRATAETVLALEPLLAHRDPVVRRGVAAVLRNQTRALEDERRNATRWSQWEIARPAALATLERVRPTVAALIGPAGLADSASRETEAWMQLRDRGCMANGLACGR